MKKITGFTLLELMAVVSVAGVLMTLAVPAMQSFIQKNKLTVFGNELVSAMQVARSGAIQMALPACVCASTNAESANPACNGDDNWEDGWIAFIDTNNGPLNGCVFEPASGDVLLKVWDGSAASNEITFRSASATINAADYVRFNQRGIPVSVQGANMQGLFKLCDARGLSQNGNVIGRGIVLSASGSLRTTKNAATIIECE